MLISCLLQRARRQGKSCTAAAHSGSTEKTSFAIKSETGLQSVFRISKFQFCVSSDFVESKFRRFSAEFYGPSNEQVRRKKCHCLNFGHLVQVSQLSVLPSYCHFTRYHAGTGTLCCINVVFLLFSRFTFQFWYFILFRFCKYRTYTRVTVKSLTPPFPNENERFIHQLEI